MSRHLRPDVGLTRNQSLVYAALADADGPLGAYTILDRLRDQGLRAPPQIYRALDKLVAIGLIHRLESLNAFVVCQRSDCEMQATVAFAICQTCGQVSELTDEGLARDIKSLAAKSDFAPNKTTIELGGICRKCRPH